MDSSHLDSSGGPARPRHGGRRRRQPGAVDRGRPGRRALLHGARQHASRSVRDGRLIIIYFLLCQGRSISHSLKTSPNLTTVMRLQSQALNHFFGPASPCAQTPVPQMRFAQSNIINCCHPNQNHQSSKNLHPPYSQNCKR